MATYTVL